MRGIQTPVRNVRRRIFKEIAKFGYEQRNLQDLEDLPYEIIPGEVAKYRDSIYRERAIVGERLRLAMGMSLNSADKPTRITKGIDESNISEKYYEPPLLQVIPSACNECKEKAFIVGEQCQGCMAHPCMEVCPKKAISFKDGYSLIDGKLEVNEEEAVAIRMIFDQYVNTDLGANGIAKYLENHGIHKIARQNGKNPLFDAALIRRIIQNPVYSGKISYGRRRTEKVHGTRNEYRQVKKDDYLLVDGLHEALVSEEVWEQAQVKVAAQAKKYEKVNRDKREKIHLLSGILKCPVCGAGMYGNKSIKKRKDGSNYKDFYYYGCKHRNMTRGHKCDYKKQVHEEMLDASVAEVISKLVSNPKFSDLIRNKINMEVDTSALDQEIENYKIQLRKLYHNKDTILSDMDSLDYEDKHYQRRKTDLENHLYKTYDKIDEAEELLVSAKTKKRSLLADKITGDNIYKALVFFDKLYAQMNEAEKREFLSQLVDNVQIYEERKENGQWLKSIEFKFRL